ncbi:MAG: tRNA epoxyqueuosine(34) reductase QueG [Verrucomicrobia bacterium]|nr:tRNA epoxyqueuosine(34) reductase QueG [Verrucomicrobiota bacterium]
MKDLIRARALELGFDVCRFASAAAPTTSGHFEEWIESGKHGEMGYLTRNAAKRVDPQQVLPGARSIVCVALNYGLSPGVKADTGSQESAPRAPASDPAQPVARGVTARYARHADYHGVMGDRLRELSRFIEERGDSGTRSLAYVDTGPLLERDFAQRAGVGFVGKHTNVISRRFGNWILLGELLTTLDLAPDPPEKNRCGSCTRCLAACPTQAILAPFQLDARLCISYLTIELKGSIPVDLRPAIGNRIFGCDDCLEVCPWNRFAAESRLMQQYRREDLATPDLLEWLTLDAAAFKQRFRGTPIERSKRRGLLRNVCVALGNVGGAESLPALQSASRDPERLIAEHALWAIAQIEARNRATASG